MLLCAALTCGFASQRFLKPVGDLPKAASSEAPLWASPSMWKSSSATRPWYELTELAESGDISSSGSKSGSSRRSLRKKGG